MVSFAGELIRMQCEELVAIADRVDALLPQIEGVPEAAAAARDAAIITRIAAGVLRGLPCDS